MRVFVFTPTCHYGGLDVNAASLVRQDYDGELMWAIGDDLFDERQRVVERNCKQLGIPTIHFEPPARREGYRRNLAAAYNQAIEFALQWEADIFVSMQDYFWLPEDTLSRTASDIQELDFKHTLTGLASLTFDPELDKVVDLHGLWTVFDEPYTDKPQKIKWHDVREDMVPADQLNAVSPIMWEANYSAFPMTVARAGCRYDEAYDKNVAYENQDFALTCLVKAEALPYIDPRIHVLGLPHKSYWPELEQADLPFSHAGKDAHYAKWSSVVGEGSGLI